MRAMLLDQPNQMSLETLDDPKPEEGQVLIKMTHAGICGTDTKIYQGKIPANYPLVMGHEIVGEIVSGDTTEIEWWDAENETFQRANFTRVPHTGGRNWWLQIFVNLSTIITVKSPEVNQFTCRINFCLMTGF